MFSLRDTLSARTVLWATRRSGPARGPSWPVAAALLLLGAGAGVLPGQETLARFGGPGQTWIRAMAADAAGNLYVTGSTNSPDSWMLRSSDAGASWVKAGQVATWVSALVVDPLDRNVLVISTTDAILKSTDAGRSWRTVYLYPAVSSYHSLVMDAADPRQLAASVPDGVIISRDAGDTWTRECSQPGCFSRLFAGSGLLATNSLLSRDWGRTWQPINIGPSVSTVLFHPSRTGWIYVTIDSRLMVSRDFGQTWTQTGDTNFRFGIEPSLVFDPADPETIYATALGSLMRSQNGGATWQKLSPPYRLDDDLAVLPQSCAGGGLFAIAGSEGVLRSLDGGLTWTLVPSGRNAQSLVVSGCDLYALRDVTWDAFATKLRPDGSPEWTTLLGGIDRDDARTVAVDDGGNVYVAGTTSSHDFPTTARYGPASPQSIFLARFTSGGRLEWTAVFGRAAGMPAVALDGDRNAYLLGQTYWPEFPITEGAASREFRETSTGFVTKFSPAGHILYSTLVSGREGLHQPTALAVNSGGEAFVAAFEWKPAPTYDRTYALVRINASGTAFAAYSVVETELSALRVAPDGTVWAASTAGPSFVPDILGPDCFEASQGNGALVQQFDAETLGRLISLVVGRGCVLSANGLDIDASSTITLALSAGSGFPLKHPFVGAPTCSVLTITGWRSGLVARVGPDGSLLYSTYLGCGDAPATAWLGNGLLAASATTLSNESIVVAVNPQPAAAISLNRITNAFSGFDVIVPGALYTLFAAGMDAEWIDLGLTATELPTRLAGVQVTFDGNPARLIHTADGRAIVIAPEEVTSPTTSVQVWFNGAVSNSVAMPVSISLLGLLTRGYPTPPHVLADGYAENQDGSVNSPVNPAARGSTIRLFVTGHHVGPVWSTWNRDRTSPQTELPVERIASGVKKVWVTVPPQVEVDEFGKASVHLSLQSNKVSPQGRIYSNGVYVYVK